MSEQSTWTQRRRRLVRCKKHDLHFDPSMTSGCALCRKEEPLANHKGPQLLVLLLALLGVAFAAYQIFKPNAATDTPRTTPSLSTLERTALVLDAEKYRAPITAFEQALFQSNAADFALLAQQIGDAANRLSNTLRQQGSGQGTDLAGQIDRLTEGFEASPLTLPKLESTRRGWRELRSRHFDFAPWMHSAARAGQDNEQANVLALRSIAEQLLNLTWEGNSQAQSGDPWADWSVQWRQRILDLRQTLPSRPGTGVGASTLLGFQQLEESFSQLLALSADPELPSRENFESSFTAVTNSIDAAQRSFDNALAN